MSDRDVIARCTRDGQVQWQQVAQQLGRSVDSVRAAYDKGYMRAYIWAPSREPRPEMDLPEDQSLRSPRHKQEPMRTSILTRLHRSEASAEIIATFIGRPLDSVRATLSGMCHEGLVQHASRFPYVWSLTDVGRATGKALCQDKAEVGEGRA